MFPASHRDNDAPHPRVERGVTNRGSIKYFHRVRSLTLRTAVACTVLVGCGGSQREAIIAEPVERPLPPASGTPIGILIDEASRLALRAEQLDALR
jgi:hypothetical protein